MLCEAALSAILKRESRLQAGGHRSKGLISILLNCLSARLSPYVATQMVLGKVTKTIIGKEFSNTRTVSAYSIQHSGGLYESNCSAENYW
jgi:hypothetical protein